ncbi:MAG TPA: hypothetical protein VK879_01675 [Candidatus Sulfomarinibacteraceae bacterium]|nr:hypothetical protein [Candidatus Sulfomarinibacteraceae bacterium]
MTKRAAPQPTDQRLATLHALPVTLPEVSSASHLREGGLPLLLYTITAAVLSWPLLRHFTTHIVGTGADPRHNLWVLWHVKEALLGRQPFWDLPMLYYPQGATLLTHGVGPVTGFLALPFWPLGPEAAHNGAVLLSLILTAWAGYLLARTLRLQQPVALFAGLFLLAAPMHLAGMLGHISKAFMAGPPLVFLGLVNTLRPNRSPAWALFTGAALLLTLAHNGYQFVFTVLILPLLALLILWRRPAELRQATARRLAIAAIACLILAGPLLLAITSAAGGSGVQVDANLGSLDLQPDALEFLLPSAETSRFFGERVARFLAPRQAQPTIESTVYLSWTGLLLAGVVLLRGKRRSRTWLVLAAVLIVLGLGPRLQLAGRTMFTEYRLPLILPYAWLTALPGLDFMRAPGRSMMVGYTLWAVAAAMGLQHLIRAGRPELERTRRWALPFLVSALILLEFWPIAWPVQRLRTTPDFYRHLAEDEEMYGVFDLPIKPAPDAWEVGYSAHYQIYQMTHGKGIAAGYISRTYDTHPLFPCLIPESQHETPDLFVNGQPADCRHNLLYQLAANNYRYVVWHQPQPEYRFYQPGSWGHAQSAELIELLYGDRPPLAADDLARVYPVPPLEEAMETIIPALERGEGWRDWEGDFRWAASPATLFITVPRHQQVTLELLPAALYDPTPGNEGVLHLTLDGSPQPPVTIRPKQPVAIPLTLSAGRHQLDLRLEAGNFRPADLGNSRDTRLLSFSVRWIDLRLPGN